MSCWAAALAALTAEARSHEAPELKSRSRSPGGKGEVPAEIEI